MMFVIMLGSAIVFTSCGSDDDDDYNGGSGSSSGSGKITVALATNKVQTVKLHKQKNEYGYDTGYGGLAEGEQVIFYKDYKYKYGLCLSGNNLTVVPYALNSSGNMAAGDYTRDNGAVSGLTDLGKLNGISEINSFFWHGSMYLDHYLGTEGYFSILYNGYSADDLYVVERKYTDGKTFSFLYSNSVGRAYRNHFYWYEITALPNHGYAIAFNTYEDGVKFMRVYEKGYTQQNDGEVTDITIEYQLFDPIVPKE